MKVILDLIHGHSDWREEDLYISAVFPLSDLRGAVPGAFGRLDRPHWGNIDPRAAFARGFGSIHQRAKSSNNLSGENYYADCDNLVKYPHQYFISIESDFRLRILVYPIYRRFFFDGIFSGRFEFGFRLNEATLHDFEITGRHLTIDAQDLATQILKSDISIRLLDGRHFDCDFSGASKFLAEGYILSSTKNEMLKTFDVEQQGALVHVDRPFIFVRSGSETKIKKINYKNKIFNSGDFEFSLSQSMRASFGFDLGILISRGRFEEESVAERVVRLLYIQLRTVVYAHSMYLEAIAKGDITASDELAKMIDALLRRLRQLEPIENDAKDASYCEAMRSLLLGSNIDVNELSRQINAALAKRSWAAKLWGLFGYADRKVDVAIEAAAKTMTKHVLNGGS